MDSVATITGKAEYKVEEVDQKLKALNAKVINAADKAMELGNAKVMNIILLGTGEVSKMKKQIHVGSIFMVNINSKKEFRLKKDLLPPEHE